MYNDYEIREVPVGYAPTRRAVEAFLGKHGLLLDRTDYYAAVFPTGSDEIVAAGGLFKDTIRCIAVEPDVSDEHLVSSLVSHLMTIVQRRGYSTVKVFTKIENTPVFESLAFNTIAATNRVVFMENSLTPLRNYVEGLKSIARQGKSGVIVMNCNPFTLGHRYLIEMAARQVDNLFVIPVVGSGTAFSYDERHAMIATGTSDIDNVVVCDGSDYSISHSTFPTYFLKRLDEAVGQQIEIDLQIYCRYIAPALNATVRFVGTEPFDPLTRQYNNMMLAELPKHGIEVRCLERMEKDGQPVSASRTRDLIAANRMHAALTQVPQTTQPYIMAKFAVDALRRELDTTPKPGLVDKANNGSHSDMDYFIMERGIDALRPFFVELAQNGLSVEELRANDIKQIGLRAEKAMLMATGGVNTHRGALFALGITVAAAQWIYAHNDGKVTKESLRHVISKVANGFEPTTTTHGGKAVAENNISGALGNAVSGYQDVFDIWLPFYRELRDDRFRNQKTLLKIMSTLDDTNVYHRAGAATMKRVHEACTMLLSHFSLSGLQEMDEVFIRHNISPGGAADMLALTIFVNAILL